MRRQEEDQVKKKEKQEKAKIKLVQTKWREERNASSSCSSLEASLSLSFFLYTVSITCFGSWCSSSRNILPKKRLLFWCRPIFRQYTLFDSQREEKEEQHQVRRWNRKFMQIVVTNVLWQVVYVCLHIHRHIYSSLMPEEIKTGNNHRQEKKEDFAPGSFYDVSMYVLLFV